ncbi:MAG: SDR family oxidoreductase [Planctomycetes bacterium]|nr:SDR family oxidoreductase [Planctomycetota bacterium]
MKALNHKAVVITGALGLLGSEMMRSFTESGWHVIAIDIKDKPASLPESVSYIQFDLGNINGYSKLKTDISQKTNNLKCLVNNAAYNPKIEDGYQAFGKFEDIDLDEWTKEVRLNLTSPVFLTKELLDTFNHSDRKNCKIVNVISTYGIVPPNQHIYKALSNKTGKQIFKPLSYSATKAALAMVTKYLSVYLAQRRFNVNGIAPGGIQNGQPKEFIDSYSKYTPMGRMAQVEEIMGVIILLSGQGSDYMNGQIIAVDGGWTVW